MYPLSHPVKGGDMNDQVGLLSREQHESHLIVSPPNDQVGSVAPRRHDLHLIVDG